MSTTETTYTSGHIFNIKRQMINLSDTLRMGHIEWARLCVDNYGEEVHGYKRRIMPVQWHQHMQYKHRMHPAIYKAIDLAPPASVEALVMAWPYESIKHEGKLAYTRSENDGYHDRQTVTTIGKFLRAHFPTLADHHIRDIVALYGKFEIKLVHTMDSMLDALYRGPNSCMRDTNETDAYADDHPYRTYDPSFGWHMAVRYQGNTVVGRALCNTRDDNKIFVRTYRKQDDSDYSCADEYLDAWLKDSGYTKADSWEGCKLAKLNRDYDSQYESGSRFIAPYLDGSVQTVEERSTYLIVDIDGTWKCDNTDGTATEENKCTCPRCNERCDEDDMAGVGIDGEDYVCDHCIENDFQMVQGHRGHRYYIDSDDAIEVDDNWYDPEYLGDNDIVMLHDGEYCLRDDAWQCEVSDKWYHNDDLDEQVLLPDGRKVHVDFYNEEPLTA